MVEKSTASVDTSMCVALFIRSTSILCTPTYCIARTIWSSGIFSWANTTATSTEGVIWVACWEVELSLGPWRWKKFQKTWIANFLGFLSVIKCVFVFIGLVIVLMISLPTFFVISFVISLLILLVISFMSSLLIFLVISFVIPLVIVLVILFLGWFMFFKWGQMKRRSQGPWLPIGKIF